MAANTQLNITGTNFDDIKTNLKTYLKGQTKFQDYDFETSTMSILLDLLSYNTYYNAVYLNQVANEMFLDSALLRNNVVSRAKMLGYTPTSIKGSTAHISLVFTPGDAPPSITVPRNTKFNSSIDGKTYTFVTTSTNVVNSAASYTANVAITEGYPLTHRFTVSAANPVRYIIPNRNVDTSSFTIKVQASASNTALSIFSRADDLTDVDSTSDVFFVHENEGGRYEVTFGDGVLGTALQEGNIISIEYRIASGTDTNGALVFTGPDTIAGYSAYTLVTSANSAGGANQESISSIKFNAPKNFATQNRAVTADDYKRIVLNGNPDLQTIRVWGGEENTPPIFGKVYVSAKPLVGTLLSQQRKNELVQFLEKRNVMSIDPEFVDPMYLYVQPDVTVRVDFTKTSATAGDIATAVTNKIVTYESDNLGNFGDNVYRHQLADFVRKIDEFAILSVGVELSMQKRFQPVTTQPTTYKIQFSNKIYNPHSSHQGAFSSSIFTFGGIANHYMDDDGDGNIRFYYYSSDQTKIYSDREAGSINYATGAVEINHKHITYAPGTEIKLIAEAADYDIFSVRNLIPLIADASITVINHATSAVDASVATVTATTGYTTRVVESGVNTVTF